MSELKGNLEDFLQHPGWKWFEAEVRHEWGAGGARFESFMDRFADSREEDPIVLQQIRQIAVARREILRILKLPVEKLATLQEVKPEVPMRPPLAAELAGQSRRGGF